VAIQIAAAVALLASAATLVRKVAQVMGDDLGVQGEHLLVLRTELPRVKYSRLEPLQRFHRTVEDEFLRVPGVVTVGTTTVVPGTSDPFIFGSSLHLEGLPRLAKTAYEVAASPRYFGAIGIEVLAGRVFDAGDRWDSPRVVVVSTAVAKAFGLTPRDIVGRRIDLSPAMPFSKWAEIIGVVGDVRIRGADGPATSALYVPLEQRPLHNSTYSPYRVIRSSDDPRPLVPALRAALQRCDPDVPPFDIRTFDELRMTAMADRRLIMRLMLALGAFALLQAVIGLYGVMRHAVDGRIRELGIRIALGASPARIRVETIVGGGGVVLAGISLGGVAAFGLWKVVSARVVNAGVLDAYGTTAAGIAVVLAAMAAAWPTVARATRIDPATVLRRE